MWSPTGVAPELADAVAWRSATHTCLATPRRAGSKDGHHRCQSPQRHFLGTVNIFVENLGAFSKGRALPPSRRACGKSAYTEVLGIGTAIMNMWIAANSLGLQGVYMGDVCVAEAEIARRLGFQRDLVGVLVLGYSSAPAAAGRVHYDVSDESRVAWHS
jgi:hypothetical protein